MTNKFFCNCRTTIYTPTAKDPYCQNNHRLWVAFPFPRILSSVGHGYTTLADFKHFCGHLPSNMVGCICMYLVASFGGHIPTFAGKSALNPSEIPKSGQQTSKCLPVKSTMGFFENSVPLNPLTPKCLRNVQRQAMVCWRGWSHG